MLRRDRVSFVFRQLWVVFSGEADLAGCGNLNVDRLG